MRRKESEQYVSTSIGYSSRWPFGSRCTLSDVYAAQFSCGATGCIVLQARSPANQRHSPAYTHGAMSLHPACARSVCSWHPMASGSWLGFST